MSKVYKCYEGCCEIRLIHFKHTEPHRKRHVYKAGFFIYDPAEDRVLLVQSRGELWGPPKGTIEENESKQDCALREVKEETGLEIKAPDFEKRFNFDRACYFYTELDSKTHPVDVQSTKDNDANGITWIKVKCLLEHIKSGRITVNRHCKETFKKFLNVSLEVHPKEEFIKIKKSK